MASVLIASLGKSPIVVTAMVKALKEQKNIFIDQVIVLYPQQQTFIEDGIALIEKHCVCRNIIRSPLPFEDANSEDRCIAFLRALYDVLEEHRTDIVYLSLAGGRKSMSALMYLPAPFFPNIKGVYHILDKYEGMKNQNFHDLNAIIDAFVEDDPALPNIMNPSSENLSLVEIPFEHFANADDFRKIIRERNLESPETVPIELEKIGSDGLEFWQTIFRKGKIPNRYDIFFSENARKQFETTNINWQNFARYFSESKLKSPDWAERSGKNGGKHHTFNGKSGDKFYLAKISRTAERVIWYKKSAHDMVVAELGVENDDNQYQRVGGSAILNEDYFSKKNISDYPDKYNIHDLPKFGNAILLATLGKSPMVITQAFILLEHFENVKIDRIAIVYPKLNPAICNGLNTLKDVFEKKKIEMISCGIEMDDVNDDAKCRSFLSHLIKTIDALNKKFPDADIRMLLSGGRKQMSALSLLAAQRSGIANVYHTLITSPELEDKLEKEGESDALQRLKSKKERARVLFLENYSHLFDNNFALVRIPVIPLKPIRSDNEQMLSIV